MAGNDLTPTQAAAALHDLREVRHGADHRAAGLSLLIWALVITSMAATVVANVAVQMLLSDGKEGEFSERSWYMATLGSIALLLFWVALGTILQRVVYSSFSLRRGPGDAAWKSALLAAGVVLASILLFGVIQDLTRAVQGIGTTPDQYDALHHNLGTAMSLAIAGTVFLAIILTQGELGLPRRQAAGLAIGAMLFGHLTTFLWFPDLGMTGAISAALVLPVGLISYGLHLWRKG